MVSASSSILVTPSNATIASSMFTSNTTAFDVTFIGNLSILITNWINQGSITLEDTANLSLRDSFLNGTIHLKDSSYLTISSSQVTSIHLYQASNLSITDSSHVETITNGLSYGSTGGYVTATNQIHVNNSQISIVYNNIIDSFDYANITLRGLHFTNMYGMNFTLLGNSLVSQANLLITVSHPQSIILNGTSNPSWHYQLYYNNYPTVPNSYLQITDAYIQGNTIIRAETTMLQNTHLIPNLASSVLTSLKIYDSKILMNQTTSSFDNITIEVIDPLELNVVSSQLTVFTVNTEQDKFLLYDTQSIIYFNDTSIQVLQLLGLYDAVLSNTNLEKAVCYARAIAPHAELGPLYHNYIRRSAVYATSGFNPAHTSFDVFTKNYDLTLSSNVSLFDVHVNNATLTIKDGTYITHFESSNTWTNATVYLQNARLYDFSFKGTNVTYVVNNSALYKTLDYSDPSVSGTNLTITIMHSLINHTLYLKSLKTITFTNTSIQALSFRISAPSTGTIVNITSTTIGTINILSSSTNPVYWYTTNTYITYMRDYTSGLSQYHVWFNNTFIETFSNLDWTKTAETHFTNTTFPYWQSQANIHLVFYSDSVKLSWSTAFENAWNSQPTGVALIQRHYKPALNDEWTPWETITQLDSSLGTYTDTEITTGYYNDYRLLINYDQGFNLYIQSEYHKYGPTDYFAVGTGITTALTLNENYQAPNEPENTTYTGSIGVDFSLTPPGGQCWWWTPFVYNAPDNVVLQIEVINTNGDTILAPTNSTDLQYFSGDGFTIEINTTGDYIIRARATSDFFRFWGEWGEITIHVISPPSPPVTETTTTKPQTESSFLPLPALIPTLLATLIISTLPSRKQQTRP